MNEWVLVFYVSAAGRAPVQDYLDSLRSTEADRILRGLQILKEFGPRVGMPHVRAVAGTDLWELRIRGGIQHRVFYLGISGRKLLLLHA